MRGYSQLCRDDWKWDSWIHIGSDDDIMGPEAHDPLKKIQWSQTWSP